MKPYDRYIVRINGNETDLLLLFANPLQSEMGVAEDDPDVIRYKAGNVYGYVSGSLTREMIDSIIDQTFEGGRE